MIKLWFEDIDWTNKDGEVIPMSRPMELITYGRLIPKYSQPIITNDTFGGKTYPVQITIYESYRIKFAVKELSVHALSKIQSCKKIWVQEYATNEILEVDTERDGLITVETSNIGTTEQSVIFSFSTKRTTTFPGIARLNTNNIHIIDADSNEFDFYTDKEILEWISDFEKSEYTYNTGQSYVSKVTGKKGIRTVLYLMESQAIQLKELISKVQPDGISINPLTDNYVPTEMGLCVLTELTEGLYKCEVQFTTENIIEYA